MKALHGGDCLLRNSPSEAAQGEVWAPLLVSSLTWGGPCPRAVVFPSPRRQVATPVGTEPCLYFCFAPLAFPMVAVCLSPIKKKKRNCSQNSVLSLGFPLQSAEAPGSLFWLLSLVFLYIQKIFTEFFLFTSELAYRNYSINVGYYIVEGGILRGV